eukprot:CAMPEP_0179144448 /NCGR_PEP_ID=MMETSP0796-20121207/69594_1 /TAXON_ID=73915 /ORGANISM="Pyrodinium bahamense, Strain pbaha01" /LENGTH=35 /DNA_ID= /DNA_START= /DNA_END= /DNA_ORIENTATION=
MAASQWAAQFHREAPRRATRGNVSGALVSWRGQVS